MCVHSMYVCQYKDLYAPIGHTYVCMLGVRAHAHTHISVCTRTHTHTHTHTLWEADTPVSAEVQECDHLTKRAGRIPPHPLHYWGPHGGAPDHPLQWPNRMGRNADRPLNEYQRGNQLINVITANSIHSPPGECSSTFTWSTFPFHTREAAVFSPVTMLSHSVDYTNQSQGEYLALSEMPLGSWPHNNIHWKKPYSCYFYSKSIDPWGHCPHQLSGSLETVVHL